MRVIEVIQHGGPEVLMLAQRSDPTPGAGEALIGVEAFGLNRPDILQRQGHYPPPPGASDLLGLEVAGTILEGDPLTLEQAGFHIGDQVCALLAGGGYAEKCVAPIGQCLPLPKGWSCTQAASLPETFFTVWSNLFDRAHLQKNETLLIHGGSSGIGVAAIQLAKAFGAKVLVTVRSDEKAQACFKLGADHVIIYTREDFVEETMRWTQGRGVDVILDMVAGPYVQRGLKCLAEEGRLVLIAFQGGARAEIDVAMLMRKRASITGSTLRARSLDFKSSIAKALHQQVWPLLDLGVIRPVIANIFPADQIQQAHRLMESNQHIGKIVMTWSNL